MNRAERRRLERNKESGQAKVVLNKDAISAIKQEAKKEAMETAFSLMLGIPILALRDTMDYNSEQIRAFSDKSMSIYESFQQGLITLKDIEDVVELETGMKIYHRGDEGFENLPVNK